MLVLHWRWPRPQLIPYPYHLVGVLPLLAGLALTSQGTTQFDRVGTNIKTFGEPDHFVTEGLFHVSRNPMYLGMVLALSGAAMLLGSLAVWLTVLTFFVVTDRWYIAFEEKVMQRKFGRRYTTYCAQVRRWL